MIKTYCDLCGTEIETADSQVNLDWHAFGVSGFVGDDYNFHAECAVRVKDAIQNFIGKPRDRYVETDMQTLARIAPEEVARLVKNTTVMRGV